MRTRTLGVLLSCIALALCLYVTPSASAASAEEEVLQVVSNFAKAINNSDYNLMSSLYLQSSKTTSFMPSSDPFLLQGYEQSVNIWKYLSEQPAGTSAPTIHQAQATILGDDVAITTAYSNHVDTDPITKKQTITHIRQTLVLQKINGKWLIVHHHASMFPTE